MEVLIKNDKVSIYGNLNVKDSRKNNVENILISLENKYVGKIGDYLYDFLYKEYEKYNFDWGYVTKTIRTTKIVVNNKIINCKSYFRLYGYVKTKTGIPQEDGKRYRFRTEYISVKNLLSTLENIYDDYICDFDTIKSGLKFVIEKIEIK